MVKTETTLRNRILTARTSIISQMLGPPSTRQKYVLRENCQQNA